MRKNSYFFVAAIMVALGAGFLLARNRLPSREEGLVSAPAYNLAKHGFSGTTLLESQGTGWTRVERRTYWMMPLFWLAEAAWYTLASTTSFSSRLLSLLIWGPICIASLWMFLDRLKPGSVVAPLASLFFATSFIFLDNISRARPEVMCCALGIASMAAYLAWRERHFLTALLIANLLIAASVLTQPNGMVHFLGLLIIILWFDRPRIGWRAVICSAFPYILAGAAWGFYISQDAPAFRDQFLGNSWSDDPNFLATLKEVAVRLGPSSHPIGPLEDGVWISYIAALAACVLIPSLRGRREVRLLLALFSCYLVYLFVLHPKFVLNSLDIVPFCAAILAVGVVWIWEAKPVLRYVLVVAVAALVVTDTAGIIILYGIHPYLGPQRAAMQFVRAHAKPDDRICASAALLYSLDFDPTMRDDPYLGLRSGRLPDLVVLDSSYRDLYRNWSEDRPRDMQQIRDRLSMYQLSYHDDDYEVYLAPELSARNLPEDPLAAFVAAQLF